jgi:hypothetical protein
VGTPWLRHVVPTLLTFPAGFLGLAGSAEGR